MRRSDEVELLDASGVSEATLTRSYRELQMVNRFLGNTRAILRLLMRYGKPRSVLDIGCGRGALLVEIREKTGARVIGLDIRPAPANTPVTILTGNAVVDPLPAAEVTVCVLMAHHLSESELTTLIRNVSRSCERLILLDLVRHPLPLALFRGFVAPFLSHVNASDGKSSIRRAYTSEEMRTIVARALVAGRPVRHLEHSVSRFWIRQVVDIAWSAARTADRDDVAEIDTSLIRC